MATQAPPTTAEREKIERDAKVAKRQKEIDAENAKISGKGTRMFVGLTRGKNPQIVEWRAFDEDSPATLPTTAVEFMELSGVSEDSALVPLLISGYNAAQYSAASDPVAEFQNPSWPPETQKQFRLIVKNYAANTGVSLEDAVSLIKPGIEAAYQKSLVA